MIYFSMMLFRILHVFFYAAVLYSVQSGYLFLYERSVYLWTKPILFIIFAFVVVSIVFKINDIIQTGYEVKKSNG